LHVQDKGIEWSSDLACIFNRSPDRKSVDLETFLNMIHPDDLSSVREHFEAVLRSEAPLDLEFRTVSPGNEVKWIDLTGVMVMDQAGNPAVVVGSARDVTMHIRSERGTDDLNEALERTRRELSMVKKELESFSYHVSHDLQAPLRSIIGFSEAVQEDCSSALDEKGKEYLGRVVAQARRLNTMLSDLLLLSRVSSRQMVVQEVDLGRIAHDVEDRLRSQDPRRKVEFIIGDTLIVSGDPDLLGTAMQCLLENAWKFSSKRAQGRIELQKARLDGIDCYFVRDNGAGFNPDRSERLFIPFQRLHTQDEFPGEGIGLALVRKIIERHSGKIWAHSAEGEGATFYFTLGLGPPNGDRGC